MNYVRLVDGEELETPQFTLDVERHPVDLKPQTWQLNSVTSTRTAINWKKVDGCDQNAVAALRVHIIRLIETSSTSHVYNTFYAIANFLRDLKTRPAPLKAVDLSSLVWYLEQLREKNSGYLFHYIRLWYSASTDRLIDNFEDDVAFALEDLRIEGNAKGYAVLSADPEMGPLSELEEIALRQALIRDNGPIQERAALWLAFAFGANAANLALLREEDFISFHFPEGLESAYFLNVPRIKKRQTLRTDFKKRAVDIPLAKIINELIAYNARIASADGFRPLFRLPEPRKKLLQSTLTGYANHHTASMLTELISNCVRRLNVISPRTGKSLKVNTRRLRYTFASKMVRMGTSPRELAELLDHTDLQQVMVYYKADSRFVERLDSTIAVHLGPTVRAFMGEIVASHNQLDLIPYRDLPALGSCGAKFVCGLSPHKSCYTCTKFNAFEDGAHVAVLGSLVIERDGYLASDNERIAQQLDTTILAVGEVVARTRGNSR
jgi:integrase